VVGRRLESGFAIVSAARLCMTESGASHNREFYGYRLSATTSRSDSRYHDTATAAIEVRPPNSDEVIHIETASSRSNHQLSKRYRAAADPTDDAIQRAESWILANRPDAVERQHQEYIQRKRVQFASVGGDRLAFVLLQQIELSATEVGKTLGLGSARKLNRLLVEWGLQRDDNRGGYDPAREEHGQHVGMYYQLKWTAAGLKAIWEASVAHGLAAGGYDEFVQRVDDSLNLFAFEREVGTDHR